MAATPHPPSSVLGGMAPARFMRRHWQKKPLLVRGAVPGIVPLLSRAQLFALASREGVESRLAQPLRGARRLEHGPVTKRAMTPD